MFVSLLVSTFIIAFVVSTIVVIIFNKSIDDILKRIIPPDISYAWAKYLRFALYVVGIGGGVRIWEFEKYLTGQNYGSNGELTTIELTTNRWVLEIYGTIIGTLQSVAMLLLVFFVFTLIAVVIIRISDMKNAKNNA